MSDRLPYLAMDADIHYDLALDTPDALGPYVEPAMRSAVVDALNAHISRLAGWPAVPARRAPFTCPAMIRGMPA